VISTVSSGELRAALEEVLAGHFGAPRRIVGMERRPSPHSSSCPLEEVDLRLDEGEPLELVVKDLDPGSRLAEASRVRPAFLYDPEREIEVYRSVLAAERLGTARCYGAVVEPSRRRCWLVLERVSGLELRFVGDLAVWEQVVAWLAGMHRRLAGGVEAAARAGRLVRYDADFYRGWMARARACARDDRARPLVEWLAARHEAVVERLVELPPTVIHGELYPSNVLVQSSAAGWRICPIDWETAAIGPGEIDVAALTAGQWSDDDRARLTLAYRAGPARRPGRPARPEAFLAAVDCCRLHLAIQMLGWSAEWSPPEHHAYDWLSEALRVAERLDLPVRARASGRAW